jgi:hypothetical protein
MLFGLFLINFIKIDFCTLLIELYYINEFIFNMSIITIDEAIQNTISALNGCVSDDPGVERILSNIKNVVLEDSLPTIIKTNISILYKTLDKAVIIVRYIESFQTYVRVYRKNDIKSIVLCLKDLETQFNTIASAVQDIKQRAKS